MYCPMYNNNYNNNNVISHPEPDEQSQGNNFTKKAFEYEITKPSI